MSKPLYYSTHCETHGSLHIRGLGQHKGKNVMRELLVIPPNTRAQKRSGCPLCAKARNKAKQLQHEGD